MPAYLILSNGGGDMRDIVHFEDLPQYYRSSNFYLRPTRGEASGQLLPKQVR